jgi:hypothetical protein
VRTFIKTAGLKGKDVYIFTTSGEPMPESRKKAFGEFASEHGLNVKWVVGLQIEKRPRQTLIKKCRSYWGNCRLSREAHKSNSRIYFNKC